MSDDGAIEQVLRAVPGGWHVFKIEYPSSAIVRDQVDIHVGRNEYGVLSIRGRVDDVIAALRGLADPMQGARRVGEGATGMVDEAVG